MIISHSFSDRIVKILKKGGVGVMPTDTIYGIVGLASNPKTVSRIYRLRQRNPKKPMIILISSLGDLRKFGARVSGATKRLLAKLWPGKISIILPCRLNKFSYLHRGKKKLAFRLPKDKNLRKLFQKIGPLVAPSANLEGESPATTIRKAKNYFGDRVDFYVDVGRLISPPSTLVEIGRDKVFLLRKGAVDISPEML